VILVFDTSGTELAIGVAAEDGTLLREVHRLPDGVTERAIHDARLAVETAKLFEEESILARDVSRIGLIIGPGSFTGLRIGLSFAKGFALATGAGIVPLTLHEVLAKESGWFDGTIITPGYKPDLFYTAEAATPNAVGVVNGGALVNLKGNIIAHSHFLTHPSQFIPPSALFFSPSLRTMALLTSIGTPITDNDIDNMEPLYLTEFTVKQS
jgi:tRNA threonylcarbamoyl adenosine modification protein YeaZ